MDPSTSLVMSVRLNRTDQSVVMVATVGTHDPATHGDHLCQSLDLLNGTKLGCLKGSRRKGEGNGCSLPTKALNINHVYRWQDQDNNSGNLTAR